MEERKRLAIACQGGGSQTAFTAGVLKKLLAKSIHEKYQVVGLSGTSGGAICALLAWYGLLKAAKGSTEPIYQGLVDFWQDNSANLLWEKILNDSLIAYRRLVEKGKIPYYETSPYDWLWQWSQNFSISQAPRKEFVDLRKLLEKHVQFSELESLSEPSSPRLFIGAVNVLSGEFKEFDSRRGEISVDAVLASAAVPTLFQAVEVNGNFYWDGLFAENPPLSKLEQTIPDELWIIGINPKTRKSIPTTPETILDRRNELAGNITLAVELRILEIYNELLERGAIKEEFLAKVPLTPTKLRLLNMSEQLAESLDYTSKLDRNPSFISKLIADGESQAERFWQNPDDEQFAIPPWWKTRDPIFDLF
jgi:NTE family protein